MKKYILVLFAICLCCACEKETGVTSSEEIQFKLSYPETKATGSSFEAGDAVSLYAVQWNGDIRNPLQIGGNFLNNEKLSFSGEIWAPERALYWADQPCDFFALYPYQSEVTSVDRYPFTLTIDQNNGGYEESDLLFAKAEHVSRGNGPVNLQFKHMMSKLTVNLVKGERFEGDIPDDVVAHIYNTAVSCTVNWATGSVEKDSFGTRQTLTMKKFSNNHFESIVVPQNLEKRTPLIELTMGGIAYLLEISLSFRPGYAYTITVTLNTSPDQEQIEISIDPETGGWN